MKKEGVISSVPKTINREALAERRKQAIELYQKGLTQYRIAKHLNVSFEAVSNWVEAYKKNGKNGLKSLGKPGPKPGRSKEGNRMVKPKNIMPPFRLEESRSLDHTSEGSKTVWGRLFKLIKKD